jgi:hypothetical protein
MRMPRWVGGGLDLRAQGRAIAVGRLGEAEQLVRVGPLGA